MLLLQGLRRGYVRNEKLGPREKLTLECQETPVLQHLHLDRVFFTLLACVPFFKFLFNPRKVPLPAASIGHNIKSIRGMLRDDSIIDDTTLFVEEDG